MLIVFAQLLTVESRMVCRQTKNTKVTKDVETIVTTWTNEQRAPRHHCSPRIQRSTNNHDRNKNNKQRHLHFSYCRPQPPSTTVARTPHPHFTIFVRIGSRFLFFLFFLSYLFFPYFFSRQRSKLLDSRILLILDTFLSQISAFDQLSTIDKSSHVFCTLLWFGVFYRSV